jgi:hypothetical protein
MPFFLPNTVQASLYLLSFSLPDKENDPENILNTGKEDAHDGAQVSLQSRVAGYILWFQISTIGGAVLLFSVIGQSMIVINSSFISIFPDILYKKSVNKHDNMDDF